MIKKYHLIAALLFLFIVSFAGFSQEITLIFDQSVHKSSLHIKRIAIIPNRLPLVLQEEEM